MKIRLIAVAPTDSRYLKEGIDTYLQRIKHYSNMEFAELPAIKKAGNLSPQELKDREGELLLKMVDSSTIVVLLDEHGAEYTSVTFSKFIQRLINTGKKTVVFFIGGAYGFSDEVYKRADYKLSLSRMTFSHQMVRLFFVEQLYRAFTILKGEQYHHE